MARLKENRARLIKRRQENNARVRWFSSEEEARLRTVVSETCSEHAPELGLALNTSLRLGFHIIRREEVPVPVQAAVEFQSACPATAPTLRLIL